MTARSAIALGLAWWLGLACEGGTSGESSTTADTSGTTTGDELQGACELEGEHRCGDDGSRVYTCQSNQWASETCRSVCGQLPEPSCALGCILTADDAHCLCFASELPCGG
ncbi:hypothetical protein [Nannocystis sp. SCPEA4]|uniref:hypothetical protein n=1 Tax=Nannocystis sp. SCPEA4 TaxID=2996787 RepID=UPI00226DA13F|nr:hypothetical protein [Nannocystis sp. SCPEA4]MCY1053916.1 hypothetical protein [Nannocystis sp. SCPEA4]